MLALGRPVARYVAVPVRSAWGFAEIKECSELHKGRCGILAKQIASNIIKHSIFVSRKPARNHPRLGSSGLSHGCRFGFVLEGEEHQRQRPGLVTTEYPTVVHAI